MKKSIFARLFTLAFIFVLAVSVSVCTSAESFEALQQSNSGKQSKTKKKGNTKSKVNQPKLVSVPPGNWGGTGVGAVIEENAVKFEFDCAEGEIEQKLMINEQGVFSFNGVFVRRGPGPIRVDKPPVRQPALYEGKISDKTMTFKITLTETKETIGEYTLQRDAHARLRRCY